MGEPSAMLDWERMFRRYVYDPERMPYGRAPEDMTRSQANYEILVAALFTGILFGVTGMAALSGTLPHGSDIMVPVYCAVTVWAAALLVFTKHAIAAAICASAPISIVVYAVVYGVPAKLATFEILLFGALLAAWIAYGWRIIRIANVYPDLPAGKPMSWRRPNPYE